MSAYRQADGQRNGKTHRRFSITVCTMVDYMRRLIRLIDSAASDRATLAELLLMIDDRSRRRNAKDLFHRIREKTLRAERTHDKRLEAQYLFEENCAKVLFNMSGGNFDRDSPYWVVPCALCAARHMGIEPMRVVAIVAGQPPG